MGILVTGIIFKGTILVDKKFYPEEGFISEEMLGDLFNGIFNFVNQTFHDDLNKFSIGNFPILLISRNLPSTGKESSEEPPILIFCIIEKDTNEKPIIDAMNSTLDQFFNRYSNFDIKTQKVEKFKKFAKRMEETFSDLALKLEDRFKALY
ncbi:hypothetical protein [Candidatus Harpocratesius sp.]